MLAYLLDEELKMDFLINMSITENYLISLLVTISYNCWENLTIEFVNSTDILQCSTKNLNEQEILCMVVKENIFYFFI